MTRTLAIVPARAGSKRIPNKNQRNFLGQPLILWAVNFALKVKDFDRVVVSTDSPEIAKLAVDVGATVPWLRQADLSADTSTSVDVVLDVIRRLENQGDFFDRVALLQPTSPVRLPERWVEAILMLDRGASAVVGVRPVSDHPYWSYVLLPGDEIVPCHPQKKDLRSQDLPPAFVPNGSLYLIRIDLLKSTRSFLPVGSKFVVCGDPVESIDIDTEDDWLEAERLVLSWKVKS